MRKPNILKFIIYCVECYSPNILSHHLLIKMIDLLNFPLNPLERPRLEYYMQQAQSLGLHATARGVFIIL